MKRFMRNYSKDEIKGVSLFNNLVIIAQSVIFALLLINAFRANTVPGVVILGAAMVIPFFLKPTEITAYIVGFSMMGTGIQVAYIALTCIISLLIKSKMKNITLISIFVFTIYELLHIITSPSDNLTEFLRYIIIYFLLFYIMFIDYEKQDKIRVVDSYIYGTIFSILHIFVETLLIFDGNLLKYVDGTFRFGYAEQLETDLTMAADPNLVGQSCSFVIVFCIALIMLGYKNKKYYLSMVIALLAGTLTISKTFLLSIVLIFVLMILFVGSWNSVKMMKRRVLLLIIVLLGCFVVLKVNPSYLDNIFSRVDTTDITTGRTANASIYLEYLMNKGENLLFGVGMQNVGEKIGFSGSPHAAIIEGVVCWGLIGVLLMLALIIASVKHNTAYVKSKMLNYIPLIIFSVLIQTTQLFRLRDRVIALIVVIVLTGISQKGDETNECQKKRIIGD